MWQFGKPCLNAKLLLFLFTLFIVPSLLSHIWDSKPRRYDKHKVFINLSEKGDSEVMTIKGHIIEVMESFPLQLIVNVEGTQYYVGLLEETSVIKAGRTVDAGILRPSLDITIRGERSETNKTAMIARSIVLE